MQRDNILLIVAVVAVGISLFNLVVTVSEFTGFATQVGSANLTIEQETSINFTTTMINWSSGKIDDGKTIAYLDSEGNVINGNWTAVSSGLVLENNGNINVTLTLQTGKTAATFIGGTTPSAPYYMWKVTNNETGSCNGGGEALNTSYFDVNQSGAAQFCKNFSYFNASNAIEIDINISIPEDSSKGTLGDTITAVAAAAN